MWIAFLISSQYIDLGDVLKPNFSATAIKGHNITRLFHRILPDVDTTYETLYTAIPKLYEELGSHGPSLLLSS